MMVQIEDIRAWVDGELDEPKASQVGQAVLADENLQQTADKLRASLLPYREAYERASVPDVPASLRASIEALQSAPDRSTVDQSPNVQDIGSAVTPDNNALKMFGIAASVLVAALVGYLAGANKTITQSAPDTSASVVAPEPSDNFAETVAAYQKFYVRETLKGTVAPNPEKVTARFASQTGMQVVIPELEGYEFMRAQRLSINGELLLQLVYLGAEGRPLALCYYAAAPEKEEGKTELTTLGMHHGLNTAEWRHKGHRFVIVSDASEKKLTELSESTRQQWSS